MRRKRKRTVAAATYNYVDKHNVDNDSNNDDKYKTYVESFRETERGAGGGGGGEQEWGGENFILQGL